MKWVNKPNVMSAGASPIGCFVDPCDFVGFTYVGLIKVKNVRPRWRAHIK